MSFTNIKTFASALAHLPMLRALKLDEVPMDVSGSAALGKSIRGVYELGISCCGLGPTEVASMFKEMGGGRALTRLKLGGNKIGDSGIRVVSEYLLSTCRDGTIPLVELDVGEDEINETGATCLAGIMSMACCLQKICLSSNKLGTAGMVSVLGKLTVAGRTPIETINLDRCQIGEEGAKAVGRLIASRGCRNIYLGRNKLCGSAIGAIVDAVVKKGYRVETLDLRGNPAGAGAIEQIAEKIVWPNQMPLYYTFRGMQRQSNDFI